MYEEIVNGGITRLAAIFNSHAPLKVGPVRSVRPTDTQVVWPLGGIFAYSGGAPYAVASISTVPGLKLIDESSAGTAMFRDPQSVRAAQPLRDRAQALRLRRHAGATAGTLLVSREIRSRPVVVQSRVSRTLPEHTTGVTWTWDATSLIVGPDTLWQGRRHRDRRARVTEERHRHVGELRERHRHRGFLRGPAGFGEGGILLDGKETMGTWSRGPQRADVIQYTPGKRQTGADDARSDLGRTLERRAGAHRHAVTIRLKAFQRRLHRRAVAFGKAQRDDRRRPTVGRSRRTR